MNNTKQKTSGQHNIHTYICINMCVFVFLCLVYKFGSTAQFKVVRETCSSLTHKGPPKLRDVKCGSHAYICISVRQYVLYMYYDRFSPLPLIYYVRRKRTRHVHHLPVMRNDS